MSKSTFNPVSTSGIGFKLEHYVQVSYFASLMLGIPIPFSDGFTIKELKFQAKHEAETDDLLVLLENGKQAYHHYLQSKKGFEINKNETFEKVIDAAYKDFIGGTFNEKYNKFIIFTDVLTKTDSDDALTMLDWARFSGNSTDFLKKLSLNKSKKNKFVYFENTLNKVAGKTLSDDDIWKFLKCFYLKSFDYLSTGSKDKEILKWYLKPYLKGAVSSDQALLKLLEFVQLSNQHGATINTENVSDEIKNLFDLTLTDKIGAELNELLKKSKSFVDTIDNTIDGFHLSRDGYLDEINEAINNCNLVVLTGEGGVGKSAIIKEYLNLIFQQELGFISIKADILDKSSFSQTLSEIGVHSDIEIIIAQWLHLPRLIVYVDSFEKLYESDHSEAFIELLQKVKHRPNITLLATCRSYAFETLRRKFKISSGDIINLQVQPLTAEELIKVVEAKPQLKSLVQNTRLHNVLSLPFYVDQALRLAETLTEKEDITESDFKNAIWEHSVERIGHGKIGHSKRRGLVFSKIVLKRAVEKQSYIGCDDSDLEIAEELYTEGFLIKHIKNESYAPKHDILEDIVVGKFLNKAFAEKENTQSFLNSIDTNPVMRRGLRAWIQDLIKSLPTESNLFLKEALASFDGNGSIIDELLVGILGSEDCYSLLSINQELILANNLKLYYRLFHLAKVAYVVPYPHKDPKRDIKSIGPAWNALLKFCNDNSSGNKDEFNFMLSDLLFHWIKQFEPSEQIPDDGTIVASFCFNILNSLTVERSTFNIKDILEILFYVIPVVENEVGKFLQKAVEVVGTKSTTSDFPVNFYRELNKLLLIEPYRCEKVYKYYSKEIIELAKIEWYSNKSPEIYSTSYQESSFRLVSYPYKYFSPSAYQTPLRFLLKYNFNEALDFIIELTNRGLSFYARSDYAKDLQKISISLDNGEVINQLGNYSLYAAYRGGTPIPDLIQSVLMALEVSLLDKAAIGEDLSDIFLKVLRTSNSVIITGVFVSVAIAYPFSIGKEIDSILKIREFFGWDITRFSSDFSGHSTSTVGNDRYYTFERYESNQLKHRKEHLEMLVTKLQFYRPVVINEIIDNHLKVVHPKDQLWKLALVRMDLRNTNPEISEDEQHIAFIPQPLPRDLQKMIDTSNQHQQHDTNAISILMYGQKLYGGELGYPPTITEWRENYKKLLAIDFKKVALFRSPDLAFATGGLKCFSEELNADEKEFCLGKILSIYEAIANNLKQGQSEGIDIFDNKSVYNILPKLLAPEFLGLVDSDKIKNYITIILLLSHGDEKQQLIQGIKSWLWDLDYEFANKCFQLCLKNAFGNSVSKQIYDANVSSSELIEVTNRLIEKLIARVEMSVDEILLNKAQTHNILLAIELVPYRLLANEFYPFIDSIVKQIPSIKNLEDDFQFANKLQELLSYFIMSDASENITDMVYLLLITADTHFKFVMDVFDWVIAIAHDKKYPDILWKHFYSIWNYMIQKDARVGFIDILLLSSLKYPETANKLNINGENRALHEIIISNPGIADKNVIANVFKLLSGIGSVYQPKSLSWLMVSLPKYETYIRPLNIQAIKYFEKFVVQLYEEHLDHIKINKDFLNYYIMLLNVLVTFGSREAFSIRDIII